MHTYQLSDYHFELPDHLIAQSPADQRDHSRLLIADGAAAPRHGTFRDILDVLGQGDLLVLNQTRVMNARCFAQRESGGKVEVFVLGIQVDPSEVPVLARPAKRLKPGDPLHFSNACVTARVVRKTEEGQIILAFDDLNALLAVIEGDGELPLPPYIKREQGPSPEDGERYQTVYARDLGAVAAPTAGLHFTDDLLERLQHQGVELCYVTHHVGVGTFKPLVAEDVRDHPMEPERYEISDQAAAQLNRAKASGRRIVAVGTTSTRCLEANYDDGFHAGPGVARSYIYPGYHFQAVDALITNFHLPGSTLFLLVSALMGRERMLTIYGEAVQREYRFYSFGDAMFLSPRVLQESSSC